MDAAGSTRESHGAGIGERSVRGSIAPREVILGRYDEIDFKPPAGVRDEAKLGLEWRREHGRGGTEVGVARARDLSNGKTISPETAKRMFSYFERHEVDKKGEGYSPGEPGFPSAGRIAWALWGGDAGFAWARKLVKQMEAADKRAAKSDAYAVPSIGRALALRSMIGLTGEGAEERTGWIHVAYPGTWEGHPDGAFTLDAAAFRACIESFEGQSNPIPVDYEHASVRDVAKAPAAGWVQALELRDDDLWAFVEWTEDAAREIRSGAYRYSSGVFVFGKPDRKTGDPIDCSLHSIALTNTPFIDGQTPIALSQRMALREESKKMMIKREDLEEILSKLSGDELDPEQLHKAVDAAEALAEAQNPEAAKAEGEEYEAQDEVEDEKTEEAEKVEARYKPKRALADMNGEPKEEMIEAQEEPSMDAGAMLASFEEVASQMGKDLAGLLAYLREMVTGESQLAANPAALSAEVAALKATVSSYGKQLEKYRKRDEAEAKSRREAEQRALSAEVDEMVKTGMIVRADVKAWRELALADATRFRSLKGTLRPAVPTGREASATPGTKSTASTAGDSLDMSEPRVRALADRFRKQWKVTDEARVTQLVRNALKIQGSAG
jgi:phage I-like protein